MHGFFVVVGMLAWPAIWFWFVKKRVGRGLFMSNVLGAIVGFVVATIILGIATPKPTEEERVAQETARRDKAAVAAKEEAIAAQRKLEEEKNKDRSTIAAIICTNYVELALKSPKSADFPFGQAEGGIQRLGEQRYKVRSYVDAKNAFGAEIRTWYLCDIQYQSGEEFEMRSWTIKQLKFEE